MYPRSEKGKRLWICEVSRGALFEADRGPKIVSTMWNVTLTYRGSGEEMGMIFVDLEPFSSH